MNDEVEKFLADLVNPATKQPYEKHTRTRYQTILTSLAQWIEVNNMRWRDLTLAQMNTYLDSHNWSDGYRNIALTVIRRFYEWRFGQGHTLSERRYRPSQVTTAQLNLSPALAEQIEQFVNGATVGNSKQPLARRTRQVYREHLLLLFRWMEEQGIMPRNLTVTQMNAYLDSHQNWSSSMRYLALCAGRKFFGWKYGHKHAICRMHEKRENSGGQRVLKDYQVTKLLDLFDPGEPHGIRNRAIITLMLDTGLRASEVCSLTLTNLDLEGGTVEARIKGGKVEPSAFFDFTTECLRAWLAIRSQYAGPGVNAIFVSMQGNGIPGRPLSRDTLRGMFRRWGKAANLGLISPHDMRRTMATMAIEAGCPTRIVQVAGHWLHISMVERYTKKLEARKLRPWSPVNRIVGYFSSKAHA